MKLNFAKEEVQLVSEFDNKQNLFNLINFNFPGLYGSEHKNKTEGMLIDSEEEEEKEFLNQKAQWMKGMNSIFLYAYYLLLLNKFFTTRFH